MNKRVEHTFRENMARIQNDAGMDVSDCTLQALKQHLALIKNNAEFKRLAADHGYPDSYDNRTADQQIWSDAIVAAEMIKLGYYWAWCEEDFEDREAYETFMRGKAMVREITVNRFREDKQIESFCRLLNELVRRFMPRV